MTDRILDIDHVMINVQDAQAAGEAFERLGFTVTPRSAMPGLANRLICFAAGDPERGVCNYIELMALTDAAVAPSPMPSLLSRRKGPVSTVMAVDDADAVRSRLSAEALAISPVLHLERDWELPGGEVISPAFAVAIPALEQTPFYWNYCQHKTPQHYVRTDFTGHDNGVCKLDAVLAVHPDPQEAAQSYARHWQVEPTGEDPVRIAPSHVALEIFSPAAFETRFATAAPPGLVGMRLVSGDLTETARAIPMAQHNKGRLVLSADVAADTLIEIVEPSADR